MIFVWAIELVRRLVWLFRIPTPEELGRINENARCPVCGECNGRLRCVVKQDLIPDNKNVLPTQKLLCQHTCERCGARWFEKPLAKKADPTTVLQSVARTELETKEDRSAILQGQ